ncbi:hypothetical protein PCASD_18682 [Puccinia coronata f. sp. avenae]|uniref:Uncharacterized protein n=1 Tax=Puccinia coronata f. sp. avenae TaxID=200324 RepID=A0A2N5SWU5_9BASI|nr:hypothetical protein PCASD_18682 [Puccinia coronata f. sp. avenae]
MEFLNDAAFEEDNGSQESWLSPTPGAKKYVLFFNLQKQAQGSQVIPRSAAALLGAFLLIILARNPAKIKENVPPPPSGAATATPGGHTPFSGTHTIFWDPTSRTHTIFWDSTPGTHSIFRYSTHGTLTIFWDSTFGFRQFKG